MITVAERFESVRIMLHLNRSQFADFLGITGSLVSCMERGTATVSRKTTARLADRLGINPVWLQYGVGDMFIRSDISLETILVDNPALKSIYDGWVDKVVRYRNAAERMRTFRAHVQINQNQLAKRLGVSRELISAIEKEKKLISVHMAEQIQELFGISAAWLLEGTGEMLLAGEPVQMQLDNLFSEQNGYEMLAQMVCALTDKLKAGDWKTLNAIYGELVGRSDVAIEENSRCELIAV